MNDRDLERRITLRAFEHVEDGSCCAHLRRLSIKEQVDLGPRMRRETTADGRSVLVRDDQEGGRE